VGLASLGRVTRNSIFMKGDHTATHRNPLQPIAAHYNALLHTATYCHSLQHSTEGIASLGCADHVSIFKETALQHTATHRSTGQHTATHRHSLQHTTTPYRGDRIPRTHGSRRGILRRQPRNTLQHIATHCNSLQHTATHCNTLQYPTGGLASLGRKDHNAVF